MNFVQIGCTFMHSGSLRLQSTRERKQQHKHANEKSQNPITSPNKTIQNAFPSEIYRASTKRKEQWNNTTKREGEGRAQQCKQNKHLLLCLEFMSDISISSIFL
jgi:hypothetical protein